MGCTWHRSSTVFAAFQHRSHHLSITHATIIFHLKASHVITLHPSYIPSQCPKIVLKTGGLRCKNTYVSMLVHTFNAYDDGCCQFVQQREGPCAAGTHAHSTEIHRLGVKAGGSVRCDLEEEKKGEERRGKGRKGEERGGKERGGEERGGKERRGEQR